MIFNCLVSMSICSISIESLITTVLATPPCSYTVVHIIDLHKRDYIMDTSFLLILIFVLTDRGIAGDPPLPLYSVARLRSAPEP